MNRRLRIPENRQLAISNGGTFCYRLTMKPPDRITLPNAISLARILLSPALVLIGALESSDWFLALFALLLISDFIDGLIARAFQQQTELGTQLDTVGDVLMSFCAIAGGWLLWPVRVEAEAPFFLAVMGLLLLSGAVTLLKYRHLPSYHTWSAKLSTSVAGIGVWILFAGLTPWVFRLSIAVLAVSALEEISITLILPCWRSNVPTVFHAWRLRRSGK